jgi:hypothetical protein
VKGQLDIFNFDSQFATVKSGDVPRNKDSFPFLPLLDSPPSGGGWHRCSCGHLSHMCSGISSGQRVRFLLPLCFTFVSAYFFFYQTFCAAVSYSHYHETLLDPYPTATLSPLLPQTCFAYTTFNLPTVRRPNRFDVRLAARHSRREAAGCT